MPIKKYIVRLTEEERSQLKDLINKGKGPAYKIKHANILLNVDVDGPNLSSVKIAKILHCHQNTVYNVKQRFVQQGLDAALNRKKQEKPSRQRKLDGAQEARLIAIACSNPPEGRAKWTLQMLADELVALKVVDSISDQTVRRTLKKNELKPHLRQCWVIPPKQNADFVANMEDVLDVYQRPYDPKKPVVCMDEQPTQLIKETRAPVKKEDGSTCYDYEYERNGTATNFMFSEPLGGWRKVNVRDRKTAVCWAHEIKELVDIDYPDAEKIILICDNLNTHKPGSLYKAFSPEEAHRILSKLEIHYTPKHGSWLNVAESELAIFTRQCLDRRIPDIKTLRQEAKQWYLNRNTNQKSVNWQFTTEDARMKLESLYPQIQMS